MQYSLFTSAERIERAWLKSHGLQCHLCAPEKSLVFWSDPCLTLSCSRTCRLPRAHHLPRSFSRLPQHKNMLHKRYNMIHSKNTQHIMHISRLSQLTSSAIKNRSGVKTYKVAGTRARQLPRSGSEKQHQLESDTCVLSRRHMGESSLPPVRLSFFVLSSHRCTRSLALGPEMR